MRRPAPGLDVGLLVGSLVVAAAFGGFAVLWHFASVARQESFAWPATTGTVVGQAEALEDRVCRSVKRPASSVSNTECRTVWVPTVTYEYRVAGASYRAVRIFQPEQRPGLDTLDAALAYARRYRAGATVAVHYDPCEPGTATLELHRQGKDDALDLVFVVGFGAVGVVALGVAAVILWRLLRRRWEAG